MLPERVEFTTVKGVELRALGLILGSCGYAWIGLVAAYGVWLGIRQMFLGVSGILFDNGIGDLYILAAVAAPGIGLVAAATKLRGRRLLPQQSQKKND